MKAIRIIRIDPFKRTTAVMMLKGKQDVTPELRRIIRAQDIGNLEICRAEQNDVSLPVMSISGLNADEAWPRWSLKGIEHDPCGISVLTGFDEQQNLLRDVPVSLDWIRRHIVWLPGESEADCDARAAELLPIINAEIRAAVAGAFITESNGAWIMPHLLDELGGPMQTLGLGTERTKGQRLTMLGEAVFVLLTKKENYDV